jgi:hypothetical protein
MALLMNDIRDLMKLIAVAMSEIPCRILLDGIADERDGGRDEAHDGRHERVSMSHPGGWRS